MPFLDQLTALTDQPAQQGALLQDWLAKRPRALFDELRPVAPIFMLPGLALVTKNRDVIDVLARDLEFGVASYESKMRRVTGEFFLGMEDGPTYEREVSIMRLASKRQDLPRLEQDIEKWATQYVGQKAALGRLDVVGDVARRWLAVILGSLLLGAIVMVALALLSEPARAKQRDGQVADGERSERMQS